MSDYALPPVAYTDESVLNSEAEQVFYKEWLCVGRETDFAESGAYLALDVLDQPVVVWRGDDGQIRAFENVCRHRMSVIADGCGVEKYLRCPFHGWTYRGDGRLKVAPRADDVVAGRDIRLPEFRVEIWFGFVFVNLDQHATPLAPRLVDLAKIIEPYEAASFQFSARQMAGAVQANWKLMIEIGLESYHFPFVHKQTLAGNLTGAPSAPKGSGAWTVSVEPRVRPLAAQPSDPSALQAQHRETTYTFGIFPSTVFNIDVDNIVWFTVLPKSAGSSSSLFGSAARTSEAVRILGADEVSSVDDYYAWGAQVGAEDNAACERVQRGLSGRRVMPGALVRTQEHCLFELHDYLRRKVPGYPEVSA